MFGFFNDPFERDSVDYYDPYTQYYRQQRAEEQRRREAELRRKQQLQRQLYQEQQLRKQREEELLRQRQEEMLRQQEEERLQQLMEQQLKERARQMHEQEKAQKRQTKPRVPIYDTKEELYQAKDLVPNKFEEGKIKNGEDASEPSDAFKTFDPNNVETEMKMFARDPESQKGFVRTGDVYSVSVKASSKAAATVEANAAGDLQIVADGKKYSFKLPAFTDRSSIRAKWNNGTLTVQVDVPSNPEQDVFVVMVE